MAVSLASSEAVVRRSAVRRTPTAPAVGVWLVLLFAGVAPGWPSSYSLGFGNSDALNTSRVETDRMNARRLLRRAGLRVALEPRRTENSGFVGRPARRFVSIRVGSESVRTLSFRYVKSRQRRHRASLSSVTSMATPTWTA